MWARRKRGETTKSIAQGLGRRPETVYNWLKTRGGVAPEPRKRSENHLTLVEREEISRGIAAGLSQRAIATKLRRSPSTVSREVERNGCAASYRAAAADGRACENARRPKPCDLSRKPALASKVAAKLRLDWSPRQISAWLKVKFPDDSSMNISAETIYKSLYIQARGVLKKELVSHLRKRRPMRSAKASPPDAVRWNAIPDLVHISERPAEAQDRAVPGHWEGDLIAGSHNTHIATLVERASRYVILVKVAGKDTQSVTSALIEQVQRLPDTWMKTLTWDQGREMAGHRAFTCATDVKVYFCDPSSPWQRGSNENTNGLLRQYFPKGTHIGVHTQAHLDYVAALLNGRPRMTLGWKCPGEVLSEMLR
jgi:IS30 family transposase